MPPPEWTGRDGPRSAVSVQLELLTRDAPISRHTGPRAELAFLRARIASAAAQGDTDAERSAATALARALVTRGAELDTATKLARRALLLGDDPSLRDELAQWFAALGEPMLAAVTLRPLAIASTGETGARLRTRTAVLLGRAGAPAEAADELFDAAREAPTDPAAPELLGSIAAWAPAAVSPERAAAAYLEAHRRHDAAGNRAAAFESLLRAFEMAPAEPAPAERLAAALEARGRQGAADEVLREHARARGHRGRTVHLRRLHAALAADAPARALGAALDAALDADSAAERFGEGAAASEYAGFHALLERLGLHELAAAHLALGLTSLTAEERAPAAVALGRLYEGALASPDRAIWAWTEALVADPASQPARSSLREHAAAERDVTALVEALLRVGRHAEPSPVVFECMMELCEVAERSDQPLLAHWAARRALELRVDEAMQAALSRLEPRVRECQARVASARRNLEQASGDARTAALAELARALSGPDAADEQIAVLTELVERAPAEPSFRARLERLLEREGRAEALEALHREALSRPDSQVDPERVRLALARLRARADDLDGALQELLPLLDDAAPHVAAWSMIVVLAARRGDATLRARALLRLAGPLPAAPRAVLMAVAADQLLDSGDVEGALAAAEQARHADPSSARPIGVMAAIALRRGPGPESAEALESAMGVIVPRPGLCEALAEAHEALGEPALALAWTQRWLALRPGDPRAARTLLGRVTEAGDAVRLADVLSWLLSQPQPLRDMASALGAALLRLSELDAARAAGLARRAIDVLGPRVEELSEVVVAIADLAGEPGLGIAMLERSLAVGAGPRAELLMEIARRRRAVGDADGAARALSRAAAEGVPASEILVALDDALPARSSDGELSLMEARAEALARSDDLPAEERARAQRELGAAFWDLAGDVEGSIAAWERAALLDKDHGMARLARDLVNFAGNAEAVTRLERFAEKHEKTEHGARAWAVTAMIALAAGENSRALAAAERALVLDATAADVLAIAERAASNDDLDTLERIYDQLGQAALGCYGERAVHYRAARLLERRDQPLRALTHAVRAFEAVPSEGITFVVMSRLAERTESSAEVVRAIERVASRQKDKGMRAEWLRRAAAIGGGGEEGARQRVEVLLRALAVRPEHSTLVSLGAALSQLLRTVPDARDIAEMRLRRAVQVLLGRVSGPEGARLSLAAAGILLGTFDARAEAWEALQRAVACDADIEGFSEFCADAPRLSELAEPAAAFVAGLQEIAADRYGHAGRPALELGAAVAEALGDQGAAARLLVAAAERDPDDADIVRRATVAAQAAGDAALVGRVIDAVPSAARIASLLDVARDAEDRGDVAGAITALERVEADENTGDSERRVARDRLRELYFRAGRRDELERLLVGELEREGVTPAARARVARDLAALVANRGDPDRALTILSRMSATLPDDRGLLEDTVTLARQAGDKRRRADALSRLVDLVPEGEMLPLLRELAPLLDELRDEDTALTRYGEILARDPKDSAALAALEREAERRGDWEKLVELLGRRASLASRVDDVRRIRLRRATVLEQRLGRAEDAAAELEAVVAATGDHLSVLRVLADLAARLGTPLRAAQLWMRASAVATDRREAADVALRAADAYLSGGDVDAARRVLDGLEAWAEPTGRLLELRVAIERQSGNAHALAVALDELATLSPASGAERAALLLESSRAFAAAGDAQEALARAQRAALLAPREPKPQLVARALEYHARRAGSAEEARMTVAELRAIADVELTPEQTELRAFLIAEALDVAVGPGAGMRELSRAHAAVGPRPLIAAAMAERLAQGGEYARALDLFEAALAGDLRGLRKRGELSLAAAEAARDAGEIERASSHVEVAVGDAATRERAVALQLSLRARKRDASVPPPAEAPPQSEAQPASPATRRSQSRPPSAGAARAAPPPKPIPREESDEPAPERTAAVPPEPRRSPSAPPRIREEIRTDPRHDPRVEPDVDAAAGSRPAAASDPDSPRPSRIMPAVTASEAKLFADLEAGDVDAGLELMNQLENRASRSHDLVSVARRVVALSPGNAKLLTRLREAALADRDPVYASAVEHVLHLFDRAVEPVRPPPLADQPEEPEAVRALLFRGVQGTACEALSLVWESASHVFRRDPSTYGVTGLERVPIGAPTPLGRAYSSAARTLGLPRTPLFQRRSAGSVTLSVALLSPPAVIVSGEATRDSSELAYHLGAMLVATLPEHALLYGMPESQARGVLGALSLAFGRPLEDKSGLAAVAHLAEVLWESIPPRSQRRLREICDDPTVLDYDVARGVAQRAVMRAGLLVSGNLAVTLREAGPDLGLAEGTVDDPLLLARACGQNPNLADLVVLATSPELAAVRWQPARSGSRQPSGTWAIY